MQVLVNQLTAALGSPRSARNRELRAALEPELAAQLGAGLRLAPPAAAATLGAAVDHLVDRGLAERTGVPHTVVLTAAGHRRHAVVQAEIEELTGRLYGDLPADDLATAGRVLALVTERAAAELAS